MVSQKEDAAIMTVQKKLDSLVILIRHRIILQPTQSTMFMVRALSMKANGKGDLLITTIPMNGLKALLSTADYFRMSNLNSGVGPILRAHMMKRTLK